MAVYEVSWHGQEVVYRFTGIRKRVLRWWKRPFWFSKKIKVTFSSNWDNPVSRWMFSGPDLSKKDWFCKHFTSNTAKSYVKWLRWKQWLRWKVWEQVCDELQHHHKQQLERHAKRAAHSAQQVHQWRRWHNAHSSFEEKLAVYKVYKQSTKRGVQSQDSPPQVVAPLAQQHRPAVVQAQPKQGATVKIEAWRLVCVRGSAERVLLQLDHSTDVWLIHDSRTHQLEPRTAREAKVRWHMATKIHLPALGRARAMPPPTRTWMTRRLQLWSEVATHLERCMQLAQQISNWTLKPGAWGTTSHRKRESHPTKPEPQRVEKTDEMRLLNIFKVPEIGFGRSSSRSQNWRLNSWRTMWACTESNIYRPAAVEQVQ